MKECSREKVLKGKKSQYDPLGGQQDQEQGVVLHDQAQEQMPPILRKSHVFDVNGIIMVWWEHNMC